MYQTLLAKLARALESAGIPYMVIGGQAVLLHGEPRLTRDIDITLGIDNLALEIVLQVAFSIGLLPTVGNISKFVKKTNVLPLRDFPTQVRVDLIFSFTPYESDAIRRSLIVEVAGARVRFAAAEDLIIHKLVAGRPRDLEDVKGVIARGVDLDEKYLEQWLGSFREVVNRDLVTEYRALK